MISEEGLQKFIDLYQKKYAIKLERQEAYDMFTRLVSIVKIVNSNDKDFPIC